MTKRRSGKNSQRRQEPNLIKDISKLSTKIEKQKKQLKKAAEVDRKMADQQLIVKF